MFVTITNGGAFEYERKNIGFVCYRYHVFNATHDWYGVDDNLHYREHARPSFLNDTFFFGLPRPLLSPNNLSHNEDFTLVDLEDKFLFDERFRADTIIKIDISEIDFCASKANYRANNLSCNFPSLFYIRTSEENGSRKIIRDILEIFFRAWNDLNIVLSLEVEEQ